MKKTRMFIDIIMLMFLMLIFNTEITGVLIHEILGIGIWVLFLVHLFLNFKWIKSMTKNIFNIKIKQKIKNLYIIDIMIFISFLVITLSGIKISQELFMFLNSSNIYLYSEIHKYASYVSVALIFIHLIMHFNFFEQALRKLMDNSNKNSNNSKVLTFLLIVVSMVILTWSFFISKEKTSNIETEESSDETTLHNTTDISEEETNIENNTTDKVSLVKYLGSLFCTGCGRHCPLSNPQCGRGEQQASNATQDYYAVYGE